MWNVKEILEATKGELLGDISLDKNFAKISIDSRSINENDVFIALKGEKFDGHDFLDQIMFKNVKLVILSDPTKIKQDYYASSMAFIKVSDTQLALEEMAIYKRNLTKATVIGITGSNGKTTNRESLKKLLANYGKSYSNEKNYNNHIGLPLTIANAPADADFIVLEMGMSAKGEISKLVEMAKPHLSVITQVNKVHSVNFNEEIEIAEAKGEIFEATKEIAIINADLKYTDYLKEKAKNNGVKQTYIFGSSHLADCKLTSYKIYDQYCNVRFELAGEEYDFDMQFNGEHLIYNALSCILTIWALKLDIKLILDKFKEFAALEGRGKQHRFVNAGQEILLIDDSYNSGPTALYNSLKHAAYYKNAGYKILAIIGDMYEIGKDELEEHMKFVKHISDLKIDYVISIGNLMEKVYEGLPDNIKIAHYENVSQASGNFSGLVPSSEKLVIVMKASNGVKLNLLVKELLEKYKD